MRNPKISVLVPTYNYADFLPEAIESVLAQDFKDYELLIVDDRSSDNTSEVVNPYLVNDERIRFEVNTVNLGMVENWNYCLRQARGEYIKYIFGDDKLSTPWALGKMAAMLDSNSGAMLAVSARKVVDENSKWIDTWNNMAKEGLYRGRSAIIRCLGRGQNLIGEPSAVLFRKAQGIRGFNSAYRQIVDLEMWFHLCEQGDLIYTREPLCCFRKHGRQQTAVNAADRVGDREMRQLQIAYERLVWDESTTWERFLFSIKLKRTLRYVFDPGLQRLEHQYRKRLGAGRYLTCLCAYKILRPFENLANSIRKRAIRWRGIKT